MGSWYTSLEGTTRISAAALVAFVGYTLLEMRYYLAKWIPGDAAAAGEVVAIVLIVAAWPWALSGARAGRRGRLKVLLGLSVFDVLVGVYDMNYVLTTAMPWPEAIGVIVVLVVGVVATLSTAGYLRKGGMTPDQSAGPERMSLA